MADRRRPLTLLCAVTNGHPEHSAAKLVEDRGVVMVDRVRISRAQQEIGKLLY